MVVNVPELTELVNRVETLENLIRRLQSPAKRKEWYSKKEAATYLNVSTKTIDNYIGRKLLKKSGASRHVNIPFSSLKNFEMITASK